MNNISKGYKLVPVELLESLLDDPVLVVRMSSDKIMAIKSAMLAASQTPPQPIYDEAKEQEKFSIQWKLEGRIYRDKNTHQWLPTSDTIEGFQMAERVHALWLGWESCAQSRAKAGEDE